jgi:transketolase
MRKAFVDCLIAERAQRSELFVLDADCARSTQTARFAERYSDSFLNVGIAEQNLVGIAAGLALMGLLPVACSFAAMLVARAGEQILQSVAYQRLPVKLAGHYAGMSGAREGAPHHSLADLSFLRAVPGMSIWIPADDGDVAALTRRMLDEPCPGYIRLCREAIRTLPEGERDDRGGHRFWKGGRDILLVGAGVGVRQVLQARQALGDLGYGSAVLAITRLKPFPREALLDHAASVRLIVTVEEHSVLGGVGGAVAEVLAEAGGPYLERIGIQDRFTETGSYEELLERYGLGPAAIAASVLDRLERIDRTQPARRQRKKR